AGDTAMARKAVARLSTYAPADSLGAYLDTKDDVWATGWAAGAFEATIGDTAIARRWQRNLAALPRGDALWDWTSSLEADIAARLAVREGDFEAAERAAERAFELWTIHSGNEMAGNPEPVMRFHLAELLFRRGETTRAKGLFQSLCPPHTWMGVLTARSAFEVGRIAQELGDLAEAEFYYSMAAKLWENGGPQIAYWRDSVQDALGNLQSGSVPK
ncbi:MAG: hypothetical protein ABIF09_14515, partial [Gemmatimonadota bacterium]